MAKYVCTACGKTYDRPMNFCVDCGGRTQEVMPQKPAQPVCSVCGAPANAGARFCGNCGGKIVIPTAPAPQYTPTPASAPEPQYTPTPASAPEPQYIPFPASAPEPQYTPTPESTRPVTGDAPESEPAEDNKPAGKKSKKKIIIITAAVVALLAVVLTVVLICVNCAGANGPFTLPTTSIEFVYDGDSGETILFSVGEKWSSTLDGRVDEMVYSMDGSIALATVEEEGDYGINWTVYYVLRDGKAKKLPDGTNRPVMSANGATVLYSRSSGGLYAYDTAEKESEKIDSEYYGEITYTVSPDGKSYLFANSDGLYLVKNDGKKESVDDDGDDLYPLGVSNNGDVIYYYNDGTEAAYASKNGGKATKLVDADGYSGSTAVVLNSDGSQAFCGNSYNDWVIYANGEKHELDVGGGIIRGASFANAYIRPFSAVSYGSVGGAVAPINYYSDFYVIDEYYDFYYVNGNFEAEEIENDVYNVIMSENGEKICYVTTDGKLYRGNAGSSDFEKIASNVEHYSVLMSKDGRDVYYEDEDKNIYHINESGDKTKVSSNEDASWLYKHITHDGYLIYYTANLYENSLELYYYKSGSKAKLISDDIVDVIVAPDAVYYYTGSAVYAATSGVDFERIATYTQGSSYDPWN